MTTTEMAQGTQGHEPGVEIIVNSRPFRVDKDPVSYAEVVALAFPTRTIDPSVYYEVTYRNAAGDEHAGTLLDGDSVKVKQGTNFHVTQTDRS